MKTRQTNVFINLACSLQGEQFKRIHLTSTVSGKIDR